MYIQWNPEQQNERMGEIIYVLIWKELQDVLSKKKEKREKNNSVQTLLSFV